MSLHRNLQRVCFGLAAFLMVPCKAAVFPVPSATAARLEITDTQGLLSWNPAGVTPAPNALTVMFWMKITLPSDYQPDEATAAAGMTILGNRRTGDWNQNHAYRFYFNYQTGNIEFTAKGTTATLPPVTLVQRPYLDRWYHLAAVRSNSAWTFYVDGRAAQLAQVPPDIGNMNSTDGVSVGGFGAAQRFYGEVQEFSVFSRFLTQQEINTNRLRDIPPGTTGLRGYYKLGYSATATDNLKNFVAAPIAPLTPVPDGVKQGTGVIEFPETDRQGEQSYFDSQKNQGRDAMTPLSGAFSWQRTIFSKPTAGIPFEFRIGCNSGISFNSESLQGDSTLYTRDSVLGPGWRHSFQTRLVPAEDFLPGAATPVDAQGRPIRFVGLLTWDGALETWRKPFGQPFKPVHNEYRGELQDGPVDSDSMIWITPERLIYVFDTPSTGGKLREIRDFNGNKVTCDYDGDGRLVKVTDSSRVAPAGEWEFTTDPANGRLKSVRSQGWTVTFDYTADNAARLQSFSHRGPKIYEAAPPMPEVNTTWSIGYAQPGGAGSPFVVNRITTPRGPNDVTVSYDKYGRKTSEADGAGRSTSYAYMTPGPREITRTDGDQRKWIETFDRKGHVIAKADPLGNTYRYEYYAAGDKDPAGNTVPSALIPVVGVLKKQTEPMGWVTLFDLYDERGNLLQKTDALGRVWKWTFPKTGDTNGRVTERGATSPVTALLNRAVKDIRPRVAGEAADWENRYTFDPYGNLTRHADDLGTLAAYAYDDRGLVTSAKDGNGNETTTTYYPQTGFPETRTSAVGTPDAATTKFEVTELGWVSRSTDALGQSVTRQFDVNGNVIRSTDHTGRFTTATYDEVGNLTASTDAKGQKTEHSYDSSNLRESTKDRAGNVSRFSYNLRSLPTTSTTPQVPIAQPTGAPVNQHLITTRTYDEAGRALRAYDPHTGDPATVADFYSEQSYDANGNITATRDRLGRISRRQYDRLNRVAVEIDPLGHTRTTTYDEAGRILTVTSPNGFTTRHVYDGRGRLKKWIDPEGNVWIYTYDGVGNITDIEDALQPPGHYVMTYDARNRRLTERNQDNLIWTYTYDLLGRLKTQTEPTKITRTLFYDPAGRLFYVQFSTGRQNFMAHDENDNVLSMIRIEQGGTLSTFTTIGYDALDRPVRSTDTFGQTVGYGYDALGRAIALAYPGDRLLSQEFDVLSRLRRQKTGTNWGAHELTYKWDKEGRLTDMTYPNGITRTAAFDESGRQTSLTYTDTKVVAPNDPKIIALNYAYDKNGNQTSAREKGLITYTPPAPHDESSDYTPAGRIKTRTDTVSAQNNCTYEFKNADGSPSFNLSKATSPAVGSLQLTYDEDSRTTSLAFTPPAGSPNTPPSTINNRYDALGRRISRTITAGQNAPATTRYILSLTGGMERILADTTASGALTALYIHGPDLAVKVDPADPASITCYHPDASGNIVRLTDQTRAPIAQYAYSDYGRSFAATAAAGSTDTNPYRFVGSQGVMEEPIVPGLYFMRARYYLADAGVFLSTDPVKKIGPGWKPEAYGYASANPMRYTDPNGEYVHILAGAAIGAVASLTIETARQWGDYLGGGKGFDGKALTAKIVSGAVEGGVSAATIGLVGGGAGGLAETAVLDLLGVEQDEDDYVIGISKGAAWGAIGDFASGLGSLSKAGGFYRGNVKGPQATTWITAFTGSHGTNNAVQSLLVGGAQAIPGAYSNTGVTGARTSGGIHLQSEGSGNNAAPRNNFAGAAYPMAQTSNTANHAISSLSSAIYSPPTTTAGSTPQTISSAGGGFGSAIRNVASAVSYVSNAGSRAVSAIAGFFRR